MHIQFLDPHVGKFLNGLEPAVFAKVFRTIDLLEQFGHQLGMPHSKKVGDSLFELRIRGKEEIRIFYTFHKGDAVLLHAFVKKSEKIPRKELLLAQHRLRMLDTV